MGPRAAPGAPRARARPGRRAPRQRARRRRDRVHDEARRHRRRLRGGRARRRAVPVRAARSGAGARPRRPRPLRPRDRRVRVVLGGTARHARRARADRFRPGGPARARHPPPAARADRPRARARAYGRGGQGARAAGPLMRAAVLHGPDDLRVEEVDEPAGDVLVRVAAATACGTDVKMLRHGHRVLGPYPSRFGHETAGVRLDTGERVLVGDSVACGACAPCHARRPQLCRAMTWVLGGFAELIAAPRAALHAIPDGLAFAGAAMAEPLAACVHAVARAGSAEADVAVLGGGTMGLMLARLLVLEGRDVTVCDRHPERRAQAEAFGARSVATLDRHAVVFEAVGRPGAWRAALDAAAPGATLGLVGGCPGGAEGALPTRPLHYDELDVRRAVHHSRAQGAPALPLLGPGAVD